MPKFTKFLREDKGATSVEYAVMLALILMVTIGAIGAFGTQSGAMWGDIQGELETHGLSGSPP